MRGEARLEQLASSSRANALPATGGEDEEAPTTREAGREAWVAFLRERFVRGEDEDFEYALVDGDEGLDGMEARDREEAYFDEEEPEWADDSDDDYDEDDNNSNGETRPKKRERVLMGETGIQDY